MQAGYTFESIGSLPGGINVYAGFNNQYETGNGVYIPNLYAGVQANVWNNLGVNVRVASMVDGDFMYYTLGLSYQFGSGAVFTPRDFSSTFPGY